jgi:hypothetical protein
MPGPGWGKDEDEDGANRRYQAAFAIAQSFPEGDLRLLDTRIALVRTGAPAQVFPSYLALLPELRALHGRDRRRPA